ncbi:MAG: site-2 protease family protein [Gemmataceae bacterium]
MERSTSGSIHLMRIWDIDVFLHWSWFLIALFQISSRRPMPAGEDGPAEPISSLFYLWRAVEYVGLFGIVLMHEFGHALACRSMGGKADTIVLWPLGGIAYVTPPPRPGALLWTIAAGPLVNLVLIFPCALTWYLIDPEWWPALREVFLTLTVINIVLFVFNMMPVYPLDGGQMVHALLWFFVGRWRSLQIASMIGGFVGVSALSLLVMLVLLQVIDLGAVLLLGLILLFILLQSLQAFRAAGHYLVVEKLPTHPECACPQCLKAPPRGTHWVCHECETRFDTFETRGQCPGCGAWYLDTTCPQCHHSHHIDRWFLYRPGEAPQEPVAWQDANSSR